MNKRVGRMMLLTVVMLLYVTSIGFAQEMRTITDMEGRRVEVPVEVKRVYAVMHCLPMVSAVAPEKVINFPMPSEQAKKYLAPVYYANSVVQKKPPMIGASSTGGMPPNGPPPNMRVAMENAIQKLQPDLIILEASPEMVGKADELQKKVNIPVFLVSTDMLKYKQGFTLLGELLDRPKEASQLVGFVTKYLDPIQEKAKRISDKDKVRVYYAEGKDGLATEPVGSSHGQIIDFIGAMNVAKKEELSSGRGPTMATLAQVISWKPQVILVATPGADHLVTYKAIVDNADWHEVAAVKDGRVYQIPWMPFSWFDRPPGANRMIGAIWTANLLYPDIYKYDMVSVVQEYFKVFYRSDISVADAQMLLATKPNEIIN